MNKTILSILTFLTCFSAIAQIETYSERMQAIKNKDLVFYNTDGYVISSQIFKKIYNDENLKSIYREYSIEKADLKVKDDSLGSNNIRVQRSEMIAEGVNQFSTYYFIENVDKTILVVQFGNNNYKNDRLERLITKHIIENKIPSYCYNPSKPDTINFAGRKIKLDNSCYWTNINSVQCPYFGEMNWSVHENINGAKSAIEAQEYITKSKKTGKIVLEENVKVIFEGVETDAKKIVYSFGAGIGVLVGAKKLIIYYVATKVRDKNISCVLSHWNNDNISPSGLPPLLEQVMKLKN